MCYFASMDRQEVKLMLDKAYKRHNTASFIPDDPVSIPHLFSAKEDIEIAGFIVAILSWGLRKTIINKSKDLLNRMDNAPYDFILHHTDKDLKRLVGFKHRTFNDTDLLYFVAALQHIYSAHGGLENVIAKPCKNEITIEKGLVNLHKVFFSLPEMPQRTRKHISSPLSGSTCKRLNMYLRWMVRKDKNGVDFGIWNEIKPSQLLCPLDVHVDRVARKLNLISRPQSDWKTVLELSENLREMDTKDPIKYDIALFGLGVIEKY